MRSEYLERLSTAAKEHEVIELVERFLMQWSPQELAAIPRDCRPGRIGDQEELADAAYELTKARIARCGGDPLLVEMETFFAHACARLSELERYQRRLVPKPTLTR